VVVDRFRVVDLRAVVPLADLRAEAGFEAFARVDVDFRAAVVDRFAAVERLAVEARLAVEREVDFFARDPVARPALEVFDPAELSSSVHLPERTRCAASATASAISEPSLDALETIVLAAACAVSAASRPASRILRRAAGLALIAAAAAASPAASISRLIAALASLSSVSLPDDPLLLLDLAIANLPFGLAAKTLQLPYGSVSATNHAFSYQGLVCPDASKGTVA
jgi:hypothetical protein